MHRFYTPAIKLGSDNTFFITEADELRHINVLRYKRGDSIITFDGRNREYKGIITDLSKRRVDVEVTKITEYDMSDFVQILLAVAVPKKNKIELIIEKAAELGVSYVIPMQTERTVVRIDTSKTRAYCNRWQKIALEASKQCGRIDTPKVHNVSDLRQVLTEIKDYDVKIIATVLESKTTLKELLKNTQKNVRKIAVLIGPEGDFREDEIEITTTQGCSPVSLGNLVLKTETASLFVLSACLYEVNLGRSIHRKVSYEKK